MQVERSPLLLLPPGRRLFEGIVLRCVADADPGDARPRAACRSSESTHTLRVLTRAPGWTSLQDRTLVCRCGASLLPTTAAAIPLAPSSFCEPQERLLGATAST